jgi:hypothetical protein
MEWRTIPGYPAYEISESGTVRKADSKYPLGKSGRRYGLWDGKQRAFFYPFELAEMAFGPRENGPESKPTETPGPALTPLAMPVPAMPNDGRIMKLERENRELRAVVAELEAELQVYRVAI